MTLSYSNPVSPTRQINLSRRTSDISIRPQPNINL